MKIGLTDFPPERKGKGKFNINIAIQNTMDLCTSEILERDERHAASLDSVCLRFVQGVDMKYSSLDGKT